MWDAVGGRQVHQLSRGFVAREFFNADIKMLASFLTPP